MLGAAAASDAPVEAPVSDAEEFAAVVAAAASLEVESRVF